MTTPWVHFAHHGFWVEPASLLAFTSWIAGRRGTVRTRASIFKGATVSAQLPAELLRAQSYAAEGRIRSGIVRCPRDSGRVQVFDLSARLVMHVTGAPAGAQAEVDARRHARPVAVPVLAVTRDGAAFIEPLLRPVREASAADARVALATLGRHFHRPVPVSPVDWAAARHADAGGDAIAEEAIEVVLAAMGNEPVLVGRVHGDLNPGNVYALGGGKVILGDWEYARNTLITYDAWFVARYYPGVAFREVARPVGAGMAEAPWLHAAHLIEWYTYLQTMAPHRAAGLRERLGREMRDAVMALGRAPTQENKG